MPTDAQQSPSTAAQTAAALEQPSAPGPLAPADPVPALGRRVGSGAAWSIGSTALMKVLSLAAQVVLGWVLSQGDFGVYALAISAASFVNALRDGGLQQVLVQRGPDGYPTWSGPVFWMALVAHGAAFAILAVLGPVLAAAYAQPQLTLMMPVIGASMLLYTPAGVLRAKLAVDLRFREGAKLTAVSAFVRYSSMIVLAVLGAGPMSFVLPLAISAVVDSLAAYIVTRDAPWRRPAQFRKWPGLLSSSAWVMAASVANGLMDQGNYLVMGFLIAATDVGIYFFAYNLVAQTGQLIANNIAGVLLPVIGRLQTEPDRCREAALRSLRSLMLISAPAGVGLGVAYVPIESIVWHGRWIDAYSVVLVLAAAYPMRAIFAVPLVVEMSRGGFRASAVMTFLIGSAIILAGAAGAIARPDAFGVALASGLCICVVFTLCCIWSLHRMGASVASVLAAIYPAWLLSIVAGAAGVWVEYRLSIAGIDPITRGIISAAVFGGVFVLGVRAMLVRDLTDVLRAMPLDLGPRFGRCLHIRL